MSNYLKKDFESRLNQAFDIAVYLQLMGAFEPYVDFQEIKVIVTETYNFFQNSSREDIEDRLPLIKSTLQKMADLFIKKYPPKKTISEIAKDWNKLFKEKQSVFNYGLLYGWLEEQMDLSHYHVYNHVPYHLRIGLGAHKGHFSIEEEFLLKDAFNTLIKAEYYYNLLDKLGNICNQNTENHSQEDYFNNYTKLTNIKYEVAAYSRMTIVGFYSFVECLVNSIGYSYLKRNPHLNLKDKDTLLGLKKNSYLSLKSKIEMFQRIIRVDHQVIIRTTDEKQVKKSFASFFSEYESLRNSSVHYSPLKKHIFLTPFDWLDHARKFSRQATELSIEFWKACFDSSEGPEYLGKLDYDEHYKNAKQRLTEIKNIEEQILDESP